MTAPGNHHALRAATAEAHARLDHRFNQFDLSERDGYGRFLRAHAAVVPALERQLDEAGLGEHLSDWRARHRSQLLRDDLAALGLEPAPAAVTLSLNSEGARWGAAYVLEGSRLGARLLAKRIPADAPRRYLEGRQSSSAWPQFLKQLEAALDAEAALPAAIVAALDVFALFEAAACREMEASLNV